MKQFNQLFNMHSIFIDTLGHYGEALLDLIYPPHISCIVCKSYLKNNQESSFCCQCLKKISFITENSCRKCSKPFANQERQEGVDTCQDCEKTQHFFHRGIAVVKYKGIIQDLIFRFKYYDATYLSRDIAYMMTSAIKKEEICGDMLMAVPLHFKREKERGYNQSHLLAKYISKDLGIKYEKNNLVRLKNTTVMHNLSKEQRKENLKNAFQLKDRQVIDGKDILLIDDIFTTGTTANTCSKVLMEGGARSVTVITFARGV